MPLVSVLVRLPESVLAAVDARAVLADRSRASWVRAALARAVETPVGQAWEGMVMPGSGGSGVVPPVAAESSSAARRGERSPAMVVFDETIVRPAADLEALVELGRANKAAEVKPHRHLGVESDDGPMRNGVQPKKWECSCGKITRRVP